MNVESFPTRRDRSTGRPRRHAARLRRPSRTVQAGAWQDREAATEIGLVTGAGGARRLLQRRGFDTGELLHCGPKCLLQRPGRVATPRAGAERRTADLREGLSSGEDVVACRRRRKLAVHDRDFDLVGIASDIMAMAAQNTDLVCDFVGAAEEVASVGVLRNE